MFKLIGEEYDPQELELLEPETVEEVYSDLSDNVYGNLGLNDEGQDENLGSFSRIENNSGNTGQEKEDPTWKGVLDYIAQEDPEHFDSSDIDHLDADDQKVTIILNHFDDLGLFSDSWSSGRCWNTENGPEEWRKAEQDLEYVHDLYEHVSGSVPTTP